MGLERVELYSGGGVELGRTRLERGKLVRERLTVGRKRRDGGRVGGGGGGRMD